MPVYHSSFNDFKGQPICGAVILPLKTKVRGPAPPAKVTDKDIIDEAMEFFRANVLFRNYSVQGPADLLLCYLTAFIAEILRHFQKCKTKDDAKKSITTVSMSQNFAIPGDKTWQMPGFFKEPSGRSDADAFRQYFRQLREELVNRVLDVAYNDKEQNKWWMQFSKRKFMNITTIS